MWLSWLSKLLVLAQVTVSVRVMKSNPVSGSTPGREPAQDLLSLCPNPYPLAPMFSLKYKERRKGGETWKQ